MTISSICKLFDIEGVYVGCKEISTGNINTTYRIRYRNKGVRQDYILQRINKNVFKNPVKVMDNIVKVTKYIQDDLVSKGLPVDKFVLCVYKTKDGSRPFIIDNFGDYWRCYLYVVNSCTYDSTTDLAVIEKVGKAFGLFQNSLDGFDAKSLYLSIPNFHNTPKRYIDFEKAVKKDKEHRVKTVKEEISKILAFKNRVSKLQELLDSGKIPCRVTHNDTKCNNVCFDNDTKEPLAVLDLDTVMPGAVAFDFGDAVRSIASSCEEDNPDVENVKIELDKYRAFAKGFVGEVKDKLTKLEKQTLNEGILTLTVELSMRFLTDYLNGDKYFKVMYPGHNLDRARNQLALAEDVVKKEQELNNILQEYLII